MKILAIETSCDETAISIVEGQGDIDQPEFTILSHLISSQADLHADWGGVVPSLAKREHAANIIPLLDQALTDSKLKQSGDSKLPLETKRQIQDIFKHEKDLADIFIKYIEQTETPEIDAIAVTYGPGLEPALWVGLNLARALKLVWDKPVWPINHMEGHIVSVLLTENKVNTKSQTLNPKLSDDEKNPKSHPPADGPNPKTDKPAVEFPALALLISGGHTELVKTSDWFQYEIIGQTRDDAVGEAFDKVARLLDLPYPGGPKIAKLAEKGQPGARPLPRPMLHSDNYDFSFSGLKTAVLYSLTDQTLTEQQKADIAREFQEAVIEVITTKAFKAIENFGIQTLIIGGGVIANQALQKSIKEKAEQTGARINILLPDPSVTTDNATMIAMAGFLRHVSNTEPETSELEARGHAKLG